MDNEFDNESNFDLNIFWKFDLLRPDCYFSVCLNKNGEGHIGFTSPNLKFRRPLKENEIEKLNRLLKLARPPILPESFHSDVVYMCDPDIPCEINVSTEDWQVVFRWSTSEEELNSSKLKSIGNIGRYMQRILPVELMGFTYPKYF
jgi:hypothetical protein